MNLAQDTYDATSAATAGRAGCPSCALNLAWDYAAADDMPQASTW